MVLFSIDITLVVIVLIVLSVNGFRRKWYIIGLVLLIEYIALLYASTVLFRPITDDGNLFPQPFWSCGAIFNGRKDVATDVVMNLLVFVPGRRTRLSASPATWGAWGWRSYCCS